LIVEGSPKPNNLKTLKQPLARVLQKSVRIDPAFGEVLLRVNTYVNTFAKKEKMLWIHDNAGRLQVPKNFELAFMRALEMAHISYESKNGLMTVGVGKA
jgi:hypothetical protein